MPEVSQDFGLDRLERMYALQANVTWRHDVDDSLDCALSMAKFDEDHGVTSTFFLRLPFPDQTWVWDDRDLAEAGKEIAGRGHTLGTHVDLHMPRGATVTGSYLLVGPCELQAKRLRHLGLDVGLRISFHAPPSSVLWREVFGYEHAMGARWRGCYFSDSRGVWHVSVEDKIMSSPYCQVNLHPEWWFLSDSDRVHHREREALKP